MVNKKAPRCGAFDLSGFFFLFLLGAFWSEHDKHPFSFKFGKGFRLADLLEAFGEFQEQEFSAFLELDSAALELNVSFHLITVFQKPFGMTRFEIEIMVVGIGCKTDLFHFGNLGLGLHFLFLLLLIVKEFIIIDDLTNGGIGVGGDLHQVELLFLSNFQGFLSGINAHFHIVAYQTNLGYTDEVIDTVFGLFTGYKSASVESTTASGRTVECRSLR